MNELIGREAGIYRPGYGYGYSAERWHSGGVGSNGIRLPAPGPGYPPSVGCGGVSLLDRLSESWKTEGGQSAMVQCGIAGVLLGSVLAAAACYLSKGSK